MPPQAQPLDFTDADFDTSPAAPASGGLDFTEEDFAPKPPQITLNPYQKAQLAGQVFREGGALGGPATDLRTFPELLKAPAAAIEATGIPDALENISADLLNRTGINPATQPGVPLAPETDSSAAVGPSELEMAFPNFAHGVKEGFRYLTTPGSAVTMPFMGLKPVEAAFTAQQLASVPDALQQAYQARSPEELGQAMVPLGVGAMMGAHLLPRTVREHLTEGEPNAGSQQETTEVHGDVRTQPEQGAGQVPQQEGGPGVQPQTPPVVKEAQLSLTNEEQAFLDAERKALDVPVEVETQPLSGNEPFAGQIATIDRARGVIRINPQEFSAWLKSVPEGNRAQAVRSLLAEEKIHLGVDDNSATAYWQGLTSLEKAIERRRYTGKWGGIGLDETMMGHEAVRFRLQQLARMEPREIAEATRINKIGLKAITALEDAVRTIREAFGTNASKEQLSILNRLQENLNVAKAVAKGASPSAYRKNRKETSEQDIMFLPPLAKGEEVERNVFPTPNAQAIEGAAAEHFDQALKSGKGASFEDFQNELKGRYGSGIRKESLWYSWQDAMSKRLMAATGKELEKALDAEKVPHGAIPDPIDIPKAHQAQFEEMAKLFSHKKVNTPRAVRQWFGPALRRRWEAIGSLMDKYSKDAGPKPEMPWTRSEVGPEEVTQIAGDRQYRSFTPDEARNPATVGEIATRNAAVDATGKGAAPRTVSKNLIALADKSGRVVLVNAWRDPRTGPKVTNPGSEGLPGSKIDAKLLQDWTPVSVMTLRDPVKDFRQVFPSEDAFNKHFGDIGVEGTPGLTDTSMFAGPEEGIQGRQPGPFKPYEQPPEPPGSKFSETGQLAGTPEFTEKDFEPSGTELTTPGRGEIRAQDPFYRSPRPESEPAEKLPVNARLALQSAAERAFPYEPTQYTPSAGLEARNIGLMPKNFGESTKPSAINKASIARQKQVINDEFTMLGRAIVAAVERGTVKKDIVGMIDGSERLGDMAAINGGASVKLASMEPFTHAQTGRLDIKGKLDNAKKWRAALQEAKTRREAAIIYRAADGDKTRLNYTAPARGARPSVPSFEEYLRRAQARAENWASDPNPLKRREGRKDLQYLDHLRELMQYAKDHWDDTVFQNTAKTFANEMQDELAYETANGFGTIEHENYTPGRYEGSFFNDNQITFPGRLLLGQNFKGPKSFQNLFHAISEGPFRMASLDLAELAEHRIAQGRKRVEMDVAFRAIKSMNDPVSNQPVALAPEAYTIPDPENPEAKITRWKVPSGKADYVLVYPREGARPLAVRRSYASLVKTLTAPSIIEGTPGMPNEKQLPLVKEALVVNQMLKHGAILLWDSFHPGRIGQYVMAVNGIKSGYKGGYSALTFRPHELNDAVRKGLITKEAAEWAQGPVDMGRGQSITRQQLLVHLVQSGLNAQKLTDALYKTAIENVPLVGKPYHNIVAPYNNWLFNRFIPGVIAESAVNNFEKLRAGNPNVKLSDLTRDIVRDTNVFFGNIGRQGWLVKSKTGQQLMQLAFLAPSWQSGLFQKEFRGAARLAGAGARAAGLDLPYRRGLPALGMLGEGIGKGLTAYIVGTQIANLATRGKFTWQNPEADHKLDAYIKLPWMKHGVWLSPLSVFAEVTHDVIRLLGTKERTWDAFRQIGMNRLSPVGKMATILATGQSPSDQYYGTTPRLLWGAASQVVPLAGASPISLSVPARAAAHAIAPNYVAPNQPGAGLRQLLSAGSGTKTELEQTPLQQMQALTRKFIAQNGYQKETGWKEIQTDDPSYSKLRSAIRNDDPATANKMLKSLLDKRTPAQIELAMKLWAKRPWTGSAQHDAELRFSLSPENENLMSNADAERMETLSKFYDLLSQ